MQRKNRKKECNGREIIIIIQLAMSNESSKCHLVYNTENCMLRNSNSKIFSNIFAICHSLMHIFFSYDETKWNEIIHLQKSFIHHNQIIIFITSNAHLISYMAANCWLSAHTLAPIHCIQRFMKRTQKKRTLTQCTRMGTLNAESWWGLGLGLGLVKFEERIISCK